MLDKRQRRGTVTRQATRGRPKVVSDEVQREAILLQARELFIAEGYARTTTEQVAARCRISKRTLYRLFPSKNALFAAIIDSHRQTMLDLPGDYDDLPLTDALERIFRIDIDARQERERTAFIRIAILESDRFPMLDTLLRKHGPEKSRALLAEWFARQRARNRIAVDDTASAAKMLMDMVFGGVEFKRKGAPDWPGNDERRAHVRRCIQIFVNGVRKR